MKTDPRAACANTEERLLWALVHDGIAHPLMALTNFSRLSLRFHDYTSSRAWPRKPSCANEPVRCFHVMSRWGVMTITHDAPGIWRARHPRVAHEYRTCATSAAEMLQKADAWFQELADNFGGKFSPLDGGRS
ncbi:hypothetical protein QZN01_20970 [Burkholderia cenocepacia]|uniref:hypothetical protein n=1 Tax=Burkholderia cenocepacia TaxID=95486 RepID=UPI0026522789|nr:hypothetical protein [Burkholderia cenocepacia]MDN7825128.1 hypothetical protein [Burkholderia cenocepacia]